MVDNYKLWSQTSDQTFKCIDESKISPEVLQEVSQDFISAEGIIQSMQPPSPKPASKLHKEMIKNYKEFKQNLKDTQAELNRIKRLAPLLALTATVSAAAAGGATGYAINQALNSAKSNGGLTANKIAIMSHHAQELTDLHIDSKQHAQIINNLSYRLQFFETQIIGNFKGTLAMTIGIDLKAIIQQLQVVTQVTLLKYNSALLAAASGKTSPYILSQDELEEIVTIAHKQRMFN